MRTLATVIVVGLLLAKTGAAQAGLILFYEVGETNASGPPYPTVPVTFDVFHPPDPAHPPDPVHILGVSLFNASFPPDPITPLPITLLGSDDGAPRSPGTVGTIDAALATPPDASFPASSLFDMIVAVMGIDPTPFLPGSPRLGAVGASAFDVLFDLRSDGFIASHTMHFAIGAGQPLAFDNVQVGVPQSSSFHLTFELVRTGDAPLDAPLFNAQLQGTAAAVPEPSALVPFALVAVVLFAPRRRRALGPSF